MSLNTAQLKADLKTVYTSTLVSTGDADAALDAFLNALGDKLEAWVKTAQIVYTTGLMAGDAPVTGTFTGRLQ